MTETKSDAIVSQPIGAHFAASLTHAFRSRLNAVLGGLELVSQTKLSAEQARFVNTAVDEGRALLYLVNDALDLGRIDAGELQLEDSVIDPVAIAEAALGAMAASFHTRQIAPACVLDPATPVSVRGDGMRLRQILVTLLEHARNATTAGSVQLRVAPHPDDLSGTRVAFQISHTGVGVAGAFRDQLFEPTLAFRAGSMQSGTSGLGLGLALCARFIAMMGGSIQYETKKDSSVFSFDVQFQRSHCADRLSTLISAVRAKRVLMVDSDTVRRVGFAEQCRSWGISVGVLADGERARALMAKARDFDLLLVHQDAEGADIAVRAALNQRIAVLVPVGAKPKPGLPTRGQRLLWLSAPLRSNTLIDALLNKPVPPMDMPDVLRAGTPARAKVLVVEDSEANRLVMCAQLQSLGCTVETVEQGAAAIRLAAQRQFDLVLTDLSLPDMHGLDVAAGIRKFAGDLGRVPIVAVTGGTHPKDRDRCLAMGMNGYLTKPLSRKDLQEVLERYVPRMAKPETVWDVAVLSQLSQEMGAANQFDVLSAFERELTQRLGRILNESNPEAIAREAHAIKSTARTFGATQLGNVAQHLEELCSAGGATLSWQPTRLELLQIGRLTLTEVSNWLDADAGHVRPLVG